MSDRESEATWMAEALGVGRVRAGERIQSLWSGYGEIYRVHLEGAPYETAIVKSVRPPAGGPRGASHARKCRSYDVEMEWYRRFSERCDERCRVPRLYASRASKNAWTFVLEDLDAAGFSERRSQPRVRDLDLCIAWLAALHATFLGAAPKGLWRVGTYWHLATRLEELSATHDRGIRELAPALDEKLNAAKFRTIVHGDAKLANFCFARDGGRVAAVDFQYVGGGCGMKDVAYLLHGVDREAERRSLDAYFVHLRRALARDVEADALEREWRGLYPVATADFERFLAGWGNV